MITSTANPQVKNLVLLKKKAKERRAQGLYLVEGVRMFCEAPVERICGIYVSESFLSQEGSAALLDGKHFEVLSDSVFSYVSDTKTPQGILCLMQMREYRPDEIAGRTKGESGNGLWLILECLQDPGNLGTIFRTAEGAGVTGILMDSSTADVYNPKTIRATMGSIYRVPFLVSEDLPALMEEMRSRGIRVFAAHLEGGAGYTEMNYTGPTAFLIGNEGNGLSEGALQAADVSVSIPMRGKLESLNASVAAGILLYEADRQRRKEG